MRAQGHRDDLGTVGQWVQTPSDEAITMRAFKAANELGWGEGSKEEYFAFVSGFRVGARDEQARAADEPTPLPLDKPGQTT